ncbi:MAG: universal stress protein [Saprospiraceae bacterium]|nr:universal stress protein [Saprospiraceae bacterium]
MKRIKKIICPVDFSDISDEALEIGTQLAEKYAAAFHLIMSYKAQFLRLTLTGMSNIVLDDYFEKTKAEVEVKMKSLAEILEKDHPFLDVQYEISDKMDAAQAILDKAKEFKADLIIMGSHGRRGINRVLMGSVAESVLRHATCGVMIYKGKSKPIK